MSFLGVRIRTKLTVFEIEHHEKGQVERRRLRQTPRSWTGHRQWMSKWKDKVKEKILCPKKEEMVFSLCTKDIL